MTVRLLACYVEMNASSRQIASDVFVIAVYIAQQLKQLTVHL